MRFTHMILGVQRYPLIATLIGLSMTPLTLIVLMATAPPAPGAILAVLLGFGSGLKSIVQGTLPLALFGGASYGARLGVMAAARQVFSAVAPFAFAALIAVTGPNGALAVFAGAGILKLALLIEVFRLYRPGP